MKLLADLKEAHDRLNQTPLTSSPWTANRSIVLNAVWAVVPPCMRDMSSEPIRRAMSWMWFLLVRVGRGSCCIRPNTFIGKFAVGVVTGRGPAEAEWTVALTEWHLADPMLVALICSLALRLRLSRARIQEFLHDWLGLALSVATINQCLHEAGRAVAPVVQDELVQAVREAQLLHADETGWKPWGQPVWLWVMTCATATLFVVGRRTREVVQCILGETFGGWLMSDGYAAYRDYTWRLRCLAHIERKARGLKDSLERQARSFGSQVLTVIEPVMAAVYQTRSSPPAMPLRIQQAKSLQALLAACIKHAESGHEKTRQLARELLNDWDTFWVVLDHPELPLTNHEAERALRHWVTARRISQGTRTGQGTRAFANLASTIDTCRKRAVSPWPYLAEVLRQRRKGLPAPSLPAPTP